MATVGVKGLNNLKRTFVILENCSRSTTNMFVFVFDEQVNHAKQNTNVKLFNLLKSCLK